MFAKYSSGRFRSRCLPRLCRANESVLYTLAPTVLKWIACGATWSLAPSCRKPPTRRSRQRPPAARRCKPNIRSSRARRSSMPSTGTRRVTNPWIQIEPKRRYGRAGVPSPIIGRAAAASHVFRRDHSGVPFSPVQPSTRSHTPWPEIPWIMGSNPGSV